MAIVFTYTATPNTGFTPLSVQFDYCYDADSNGTCDPLPGGVTLFWDFGDGNTSTENNPIHNYTNPDTYIVTCLPSNFIPPATNAITVTVTDPPPPPPPVIFYYAGVVNYVSGTVGWTLNWAETSPGIIPYIDNTGLPQEKVGIAFTDPLLGGARGTVTITATVNGLPATSGITALVAELPVPVVDFSGTPLSGIAPLSVAFTDLSTNSPTSWAWEFENNGLTDSTLQNPTHIYPSAGTYSVKLTATNAGGSGMLVKTSYIVVTGIPPIIGFSSTEFNSPTGVPAVVDIVRTGNLGAASSINWVLTANHTINTPNPPSGTASFGVGDSLVTISVSIGLMQGGEASDSGKMVLSSPVNATIGYSVTDINWGGFGGGG